LNLEVRVHNRNKERDMMFTDTVDATSWLNEHGFTVETTGDAFAEGGELFDVRWPDGEKVTPGPMSLGEFRFWFLGFCVGLKAER
jgi:hypothetical protein